MKRSIYAAAGAFAIILLTSHFRSSPYNNYVLLADAWLHGHVWIHSPGAYIDALSYRGASYVIEAPMPAVLLLPLVAAFGLAANQTLLAVALGAVCIGAAWEICERVGVGPKDTAWLCLFLLAGTDVLWCAMLGDVWFIAHVSAACFTLLAIVECLGKRRPWLVALLAVCALESRFRMALAIPAYIYWLSEGRDALRRSLRQFGAVLAAWAVLWVAYNWARWGVPFDIGYTAWYHQDRAGMPSGSPFRLSYLGYQLRSFFWLPPLLQPSAPFLTPSIEGVALTWTSPALVLAVRARGPIRWVGCLWAAALLTALPNLLYYVNGYAQFGMRHALDFIPFLFALMALGARRGVPPWGKILMAYSVIAGAWGCWYWNSVVRTQF
ncbi:MAG: hypothetical protein NVS1B14_05490 [Vulcanimicrobiaceae bacterium]